MHHSTPQTSFLALPEELRVDILLSLDVRDILTCRTLCRPLRTLIDSEATIRCKLELSAAGMIDTSAQRTVTLPARERLQRLRAYEETWRSADPLFRHSLGDMDPAPGDLNFWPPVGGVICYHNKGDSALKLFRPPSISRDVPEMIWHIHPHDSLADDIISIAVDMAQDLIVVSQLLPNGGYTIRVLSISHGGSPHPHAAKSAISGTDNDMQRTYIHDGVQIMGNLVSWDGSRITSGGYHHDMRIWNWKTGALLWTRHHPYQTVFSLLDLCTALAIPEGGYTIFLYRFDFDAQAPIHDPSPAHVLELPSLSASTTARMYWFDIPVAPPPHPDCQPLFAPDPALQICAMAFDITYRDKHRTTTYDETLLMLVPLATFKGIAAAGEKKSGMNATTSVRVPWDAWGVDGTRCHRLHQNTEWIFVTGSKCVVYYPRYGDSGSKNAGSVADVLVLDARPWVHLPRPGLEPPPVPSAQPLHRWVRPSYRNDHAPFISPLISKYPCRVFHREFCLNKAVDASGMLLTDDLYAFAFRGDPEDPASPEAAGLGGFQMFCT